MSHRDVSCRYFQQPGPVNGDVACLGGTGRGIDRALLRGPANASPIFDLRIGKIICNPSDV